MADFEELRVSGGAGVESGGRGGGEGRRGSRSVAGRHLLVSRGMVGGATSPARVLAGSRAGGGGERGGRGRPGRAGAAYPEPRPAVGGSGRGSAHLTRGRGRGREGLVGTRLPCFRAEVGSWICFSTFTGCTCAWRFRSLHVTHLVGDCFLKREVAFRNRLLGLMLLFSEICHEKGPFHLPALLLGEARGLWGAVPLIIDLKP